MTGPTLPPILWWSAQMADRRRHDDEFGPGVIVELGDTGLFFAASDAGWSALNELPADARRLVVEHQAHERERTPARTARRIEEARFDQEQGYGSSTDVVASLLREIDRLASSRPAGDDTAPPAEACHAAAFDGHGCPGRIINGQCTEQDDHHATAGMVPCCGPGEHDDPPGGPRARDTAPDGEPIQTEDRPGLRRALADITEARDAAERSGDGHVREGLDEALEIVRGQLPVRPAGDDVDPDQALRDAIDMLARRVLNDQDAAETEHYLGRRIDLFRMALADHEQDGGCGATECFAVREARKILAAGGAR